MRLLRGVLVTALMLFVCMLPWTWTDVLHDWQMWVGWLVVMLGMWAAINWVIRQERKGW